MNVKLVTWTNQPLKTIFWAFLNMHNKVPDNLDDVKVSDEELSEFFEVLMEQPHQTVLEYINLVWYIGGGSRSFQQQLTRTRLAAYSIASLRIVSCSEFAFEENYKKPSKIYADHKLRVEYEDAMVDAQIHYNNLIGLGAVTEDAREVLPLAVTSPITMSIDFRSLYHMLEFRFCYNTQEEYRQVAELMKEEVTKKIGDVFNKPMNPICFRLGYCPSPFPCNKYGFDNKIKGDVSRWLKG